MCLRVLEGSICRLPSDQVGGVIVFLGLEVEPLTQRTLRVLGSGMITSKVGFLARRVCVAAVSTMPQCITITEQRR